MSWRSWDNSTKSDVRSSHKLDLMGDFTRFIALNERSNSVEAGAIVFLNRTSFMMFGKLVGLCLSIEIKTLQNVILV